MHRPTISLLPQRLGLSVAATLAILGTLAIPIRASQVPALLRQSAQAEIKATSFMVTEVTTTVGGGHKETLRTTLYIVTRSGERYSYSTSKIVIAGHVYNSLSYSSPTETCTKFMASVPWSCMKTPGGPAKVLSSLVISSW